MEASKVTLSDAEHRLLEDATVILTKNSVIDKICQLFGELGNQFYASCSDFRDNYPSLFNLHPKVSKGEKHQDLPWVMLDYPRNFNTDGHLAIRCFCWWGNYFSIQLQVSGKFITPIESILKLSASQEFREWFIGYTPDPWNLSLPPTDWVPFQAGLGTQKLAFLKLAQKIDIVNFNLLEAKMKENFGKLIGLIDAAFRLQYGEIIP